MENQTDTETKAYKPNKKNQNPIHKAIPRRNSQYNKPQSEKHAQRRTFRFFLALHPHPTSYTQLASSTE